MSSTPSARVSRTASRTPRNSFRKRAPPPITFKPRCKCCKTAPQRNADALDSLPESPGGKIQQLQDYDFMEPEAREKFNELLDSLKQQMMQNFFQDMKQQLQDMSPQDMEGIKNMIQALNQMLRDRAMGEDPDFEGFMEQYGEYFDPNRPRKP